MFADQVKVMERMDDFIQGLHDFDKRVRPEASKEKFSVERYGKKQRFLRGSI
jgi:hypothetical protein